MSRCSPSLPQLVVRPASREDVAAIHALEMAAFAQDRVTLRGLRRFAAAPHRPLLAAKFGDELVGYILLALRKGGKTCRVYSFAVRAERRRRGVGQELLRAAERYARAHGREAVRLEVRYDNAAAISLYVKYGYREFGRYSAYYADGATALRFEKRFPATPVSSIAGRDNESFESRR